VLPGGVVVVVCDEQLDEELWHGSTVPVGDGGPKLRNT
jgi:hypothetical protein